MQVIDAEHRKRVQLSCSERSDAKHPRHSCVWDVCLAERTYRACPGIEVRPLFQRGYCLLARIVWRNLVRIFRRETILEIAESLTKTLYEQIWGWCLSAAE